MTDIDEALAAFHTDKNEPEPDDLTVAYMAGSASRLDELRAKDAEIAELKRNLGSLRRQINEMDAEDGDDIDAAFMQMQRARAAQKKAEAERDAALAKLEIGISIARHARDTAEEHAAEARRETAALKSAQRDLQPLHDLVKSLATDGIPEPPETEWMQGHRDALRSAAFSLKAALAKLQSAGEVK